MEDGQHGAAVDSQSESVFLLDSSQEKRERTTPTALMCST